MTSATSAANAMLQAALAYAKRDWAVLPVKRGGKAPLTAHGIKDATTDPDMIRAWWAKWPSAGVALACGTPSGGLIVLDCDKAEFVWSLENACGPLPETLTVATGRGTHRYFVAPEEIKTQQLAPHLELRGEGSYVLAPPSVHPSGARYRVTNDVEPAPMPDALRELTRSPVNSKPSMTVETKIIEGARNSALTSFAGAMRRRGMSREAIEAALLAENSRRCEPPLPEPEVRGVAASVARYASAAKKPGVPGTTAAPAAAMPMPTMTLTIEQGRAMLSDLLFAIGGFLNSYLSISTAQTHVLAVWVFHTHVIDAADRTPYLHISSPEKRCGKTLLLDLLALLTCRAWFTSNATTAALARKIAEQKPTVLLDEADTMLSGEGERVETLRGILNAGYARGGTFTRCVGEGSRQTPTDFEVFTAKAIAGLRALPDTVADRSISIRMKRALPGEIRQRFYRREAEPIATTLKARIEQCAVALLPSLKEARPERVLELHDRANDIVEPLLGIADQAGDSWPEYLRIYLRELFAGQDELEQTLSLRLLADVREVFAARGVERLPTTDLIQALHDRPESPWADWRGRGLKAHGLARLLRAFGVSPIKWRDDAQVLRGYQSGAFADCWARYLPALPSQEGMEAPQTPQSDESTS